MQTPYWYNPRQASWGGPAPFTRLESPTSTLRIPLSEEFLCANPEFVGDIWTLIIDHWPLVIYRLRLCSKQRSVKTTDYYNVFRLSQCFKLVEAETYRPLPLPHCPLGRHHLPVDATTDGHHLQFYDIMTRAFEAREPQHAKMIASLASYGQPLPSSYQKCLAVDTISDFIAHGGTLPAGPKPRDADFGPDGLTTTRFLKAILWRIRNDGTWYPLTEECPWVAYPLFVDRHSCFPALFGIIMAGKLRHPQAAEFILKWLRRPDDAAFYLEIWKIGCLFYVLPNDGDVYLHQFALATLPDNLYFNVIVRPVAGTSDKESEQLLRVLQLKENLRNTPTTFPLAVQAAFFASACNAVKQRSDNVGGLLCLIEDVVFSLLEENPAQPPFPLPVYQFYVDIVARHYLRTIDTRAIHHLVIASLVAALNGTLSQLFLIKMRHRLPPNHTKFCASPIFNNKHLYSFAHGYRGKDFGDRLFRWGLFLHAHNLVDCRHGNTPSAMQMFMLCKFRNIPDDVPFDAIVRFIVDTEGADPGPLGNMYNPDADLNIFATSQYTFS